MDIAKVVSLYREGLSLHDIARARGEGAAKPARVPKELSAEAQIRTGRAANAAKVAKVEVGATTVARWLEQAGEPRRGTQEASQRRWPRVLVTSPTCGRELWVRQSRSKRATKAVYCSRPCLWRRPRS